MEEIFEQIKQFASEGDDEQALKLVNKVLKTSPQDPEALYCKIVSLIKLNQHAEALKVYESCPEDLKTELVFQRAYILYRVGREEECLDLLNEQEELPIFFQHLKAQLLYKMNQSSEAVNIYSEIMQQVDPNDAYMEEIQANANAALACALEEDSNVSLSVPADATDTWEMAYNVACVKLAEGNFKAAISFLEKALDLGKKALEQEEYKPEDIEKELGPVSVQLAFAFQMNGQFDSASNLYTEILNKKLSDKLTLGVASNNILSLKKNPSLVDVIKYYKSISNREIVAKLNYLQKLKVFVNGAVFSSILKKNSGVGDFCKKIQENYPKSDIVALISAGILFSKKKFDQCTLELKNSLLNFPESVSIRLALAQLAIQQEKYSEAIEILQKLKLEKPGIVSLLVWLYARINESEKVVILLEKATSQWEASQKSESIIQQLADFKLKSNQAKAAAKEYEKLVKQNPQNLENVAKLVLAYAEFDLNLAEKYSVYLTDVDFNDSTIDLTSLEKGVGILNVKNIVQEQVSVKKRTRTKKIRLPKNYDPNKTPDPERWLPKRERSSFKKTKKNLLKGPQGSFTAGGGLGSTGSAKIPGFSVKGKEPMVEKPVVAPAPVAAKKKKKGKK